MGPVGFELSLINGLILVASALTVMGVVGLFLSIPTPTSGTFSIRRRQALESSPIFEWCHPLILHLASRNARLYSQETRNDFEVRIKRAGRPADLTPEEYLAICQIVALVCCAIAFIYGSLFLGIGGIIGGVLAFVLGYFAPIFVLNEMMNTRITKLVIRLPYAIDLLALCLSSGSTFLGAVEELVKGGGDDPLDQEFRVFMTELSLGKTRREALLNLADRCGIELLNNLVISLIQGEEQGVHVAEILRRQAADIRGVRVAKADEKAGKASTKILFPTMLILMSVLLIIFGGFFVKLARGKVFAE